MRDAAVEAYEGVEHGLMIEGDFRDFVFVDTIKLHAGIRISSRARLEKEAEKVLAELRDKEVVTAIGTAKSAIG